MKLTMRIEKLKQGGRKNISLKVNAIATQLVLIPTEGIASTKTRKIPWLNEAAACASFATEQLFSWAHFLEKKMWPPTSLQTRCQKFKPTWNRNTCRNIFEIDNLLPLIPHFDFFSVNWLAGYHSNSGPFSWDSHLASASHDGVIIAIPCLVNEDALDKCVDTGHWLWLYTKGAKVHRMRCRELSIVCIHQIPSPHLSHAIAAGLLSWHGKIWSWGVGCFRNAWAIKHNAGMIDGL